MKKIEYRQIGIIRTPFKTPSGTPIQPTGAAGVKAKVEIFTEYCQGLADLEGFSHIILLYLFHLSKKFKLKVKPFLDEELRGLFATRAPARPNPVGISVVRLIKVDDAVLYIEDIDVVDKTPLLDIKPYIPEFDIRKVNRTGWMEEKAKTVKEIKDDGRFVK
ncbi:MAG: tRNA (N6-threonylcarbamoyladenosine(37)-N6)-methyltransferase TrmO [Deltaproteobacteria bacterium]|nr:tRNA (N6-threonylcarbamoyladenosine(37)-N6)-methyltransferase TrmO [Deltaproteobacteria bacterium]